MSFSFISAPRNLLWLVPLALFVTYPLWRGPAILFLNPDAGPAPDGQVTEIAAGRSADMEGVSFSQFRNGAEEWQIKAEQLSMADDENDLRLREIKAEFFGRQHEDAAPRRTTIFSQAGHYEGQKKLLTLSGAVRLETEDGYAMRAERLTYAGMRDKVKASGDVKVTAKGMEARGRSFEYNIDSGTFRLLSNVAFRAW